MSTTKRALHPPRELSDQAIAWIVRLHSGEADGGDRQAFRDWRAQSTAHEAAAAEAEMLWRETADIGIDPATGLALPGGRKKNVTRRAMLGGAAIAAIGAAGFRLIPSTAAWSADHATGTGETRTVPLDDGSRLTLNAMSSLDVDYSESQRRIVMRGGQAFFEVAPDIGRPFTVEAGGTTTVALGTAFDVNMNLPGDHIAISVAAHSVRVDAARGEAGFVVGAGERVVISPDGASDISRQDPAVAESWRRGTYIAEARPLEEVIAALSAYYEGWIVVRGDAVKSLSVNAVLDLAQPQAALDTLAAGLPIRVRRISGYITLITET